MVRIKNHFCVLVTFLLISALVSGSFFNVRKANAIAPAVPAAGAAVAALAAELGISEGALALGVLGIGVVATGLAATGDWTDTANPPAPGWEAWDDLPDAVKDRYRGTDNPPQEEYYNDAVTWWALQTGLVQQSQNGGYEPTPEPDPDNDPDGHAKWQKSRNVLIALAAGGLSVPLSDAVGVLGDNVGAKLKEMLFGVTSTPNSLALGLLYSANLYDSGSNNPIPMQIISTAHYRDRNGTIYNLTTVDWSGCELNGGNYLFGYPELNEVQTYNMQATSDGWLASNAVYTWRFIGLEGETFQGAGRLQLGAGYSNGVAWVLNAGYKGTYNFPSGASYSNGVSNGLTMNDVEYGQMQDTPTQLENNILEPVNYNNFINNYTNDTGTADTTRTVTLPSGFGQPGFSPSYESFVNVTPDTDVTPIPDDAPIDVTNPNPNPNPNPGGDSQFQEDYGQQVVRLLAQPFDQLFPFCLIGDLHRFVDMMADAGNPQAEAMRTQGERTVNGTENLVFPLSDFGVDGLDDISIDLTPVHDLAAMVRGPLTGLFICGLIVGTFRFFLTRGGE